jgi:hypothetical protein
LDMAGNVGGRRDGRKSGGGVMGGAREIRGAGDDRGLRWGRFA